MNDALFILVAYKSNSSDYCRGCHMASYHSEHKLDINLNRERLIKEWARYTAYETKVGESGYDISVFGIVEGKIVLLYSDSHGGIEDFLGFDYDQRCDFEEIPEYIALEKEVSEIRDIVNRRVKNIIAKRLFDKQEMARKNKETEDNRKKQSELNQLAALKAKYNQ